MRANRKQWRYKRHRSKWSRRIRQPPNTKNRGLGWQGK